MRRSLIVTVDEAEALVDRAVRIAEAEGIAVVAAFVGTDGGLLAFKRAEGAIKLFADAAVRKAQTAVMLCGDTSQLTDFNEWDESGLAGITSIGGFPWAGGVAVYGPDGILLGGLGVSGADEGEKDEAIAQEARDNQDFRIVDEELVTDEPERESVYELDALDGGAAAVAAADLVEAAAEPENGDGQAADVDFTATQRLPLTDPTSRDLRAGPDGLPPGGHAAAYGLIGTEGHLDNIPLGDPADVLSDNVGGAPGAAQQSLMRLPFSGPLGGPVTSVPERLFGDPSGALNVHEAGPGGVEIGTTPMEGAATTTDPRAGSADGDGIGDDGAAAPAVNEPLSGGSAYPAPAGATDNPDQRGGHAGEHVEPGKHD